MQGFLISQLMKATLFAFTCCSCLNSLLPYVSTCVRFVLCNYLVFMLQLFVFFGPSVLSILGHALLIVCIFVLDWFVHLFM